MLTELNYMYMRFGVRCTLNGIVAFRWQYHEAALEVACFQTVDMGLDHTCASGKTCSKHGVKEYIFIQLSFMVAYLYSCLSW